MTEPNDVAREVALAEFEALRAEIVGLQTAQAALALAFLTVVGVVTGFVISDNGPTTVLLVIPYVAAGIAMISAATGIRTHELGRYIEVGLWPVLAARTQEGRLVSWEATRSTVRRASRLPLSPAVGEALVFPLRRSLLW